MGRGQAARRVRSAWPLVCLIGFVSTATACIVNETRCDENQVQDHVNSLLCKCAPNSVPSARGYGCDRCSDLEEIRGGKCECKPGYERGAGGACERSATTTLWQPCSEAEPCAEPYPLCVSVGGERFCTSPGCTKHTDCPEDFICRSQDGVRFCSKVHGMVKPCTSLADCAGTEALYCETLQARVCLVSDCTGSSCASGWSCCDYRSFIGTSLCIRTSRLDDGKCIDGSRPLSP